MKIYPYL